MKEIVRLGDGSFLLEGRNLEKEKDYGSDG